MKTGGRKFAFYKQHDAMDCGPTCLRMIARQYGRDYPLNFLREQCFLTREGVSMLGISEAAETIGFRTLAVKLNLNTLIEEAPLPCILHWNQNHFVVLHKARKNSFLVADPGHGMIHLDRDAFESAWTSESDKGVALVMEPTPKFYEEVIETSKPHKGFFFLLKYLRPFRRYILQLILGMLIVSILTLFFPFLTQALVDYGIQHRNAGFVVLILGAQIALFMGSTCIELIRSWLMLHINARVNILLISDFLIKLMGLPLRYFDSKLTGDIHQRIGDHERIQSFLTGPALHTLFSMVNLIVFVVVLGIYSSSILWLYVGFSFLGIGWIVLFLKRRKHLDYIRFQRMSDNQNVLVELITGMQEIKLNNCESKKRWSWENVQAKIYSLNIKSLALGQTQQIGSDFFHQIKNILITYIAAREVMNGQMTMGMMLSVSYIIGQLNAPIEGLLSFIHSSQDAKISLDRLSEIHNLKEESPANQNEWMPTAQTSLQPLHLSATAPVGIQLKQVSFQYQGAHSPYALHNINLHIPKGKVTAIVGASGSGKTTLLKLLLQFYEPTSGCIEVNHENLASIHPKRWRRLCGSVMQEGFIFSDSIANNIAVSDDILDQSQLLKAVEVANIRDFIETLPMRYQTRIGQSGAGISVGQKQRLLIARAVYKNPEYLFFDEATSALDANNERAIIEHLESFYENRTVVIVAHRLSTVKHADQIVVLDQGEIKEIGNHQELVAQKGLYYELIKNQLELGN